MKLIGRTIIAIAILALSVTSCAPAENLARTDAPSSAAADPDKFSEVLKGSWMCAMKGNDTFDIMTDEDPPASEHRRGFGLYSSGSYQLTISDDTWESRAIPADVNDHAIDASGTYNLSNGTLTFKIERYVYADGTTSSPSHDLDQRAIGKDFSITNMPEKISEFAEPGIKNADNYKTRMTATRNSIKLQQGNNSTVECFKP